MIEQPKKVQIKWTKGMFKGLVKVIEWYHPEIGKVYRPMMGNDEFIVLDFVCEACGAIGVDHEEHDLCDRCFQEINNDQIIGYRKGE